MDAYEILYPLLSDLVAGEAYPETIPERENGETQPAPYLLFNEVGTTPENCIDGFLGHEYSRVQVDVYHYTKDECNELARHVIAKLNTLKGSNYIGRRRLPDPATNLARQSIDYEIWTKF